MYFLIMVGLSGKGHLIKDLEKTPDVAYDYVLKEFEMVWCVKTPDRI